MNDQPEVTVEQINAKLIPAFQQLYPDSTIQVVHNGEIADGEEDETIDVIVSEGPTFRADIYSDDDDFLRFRPYDEDYEAEFPDEDPYDFVMIRVRIFDASANEAEYRKED